MLYAEDITDEAPYLFSELPGRFTGSYSGYNDDPLYVTVCPLRPPLRKSQVSDMLCTIWLSCCHGSLGMTSTLSWLPRGILVASYLHHGCHGLSTLS